VTELRENPVVGGLAFYVWGIDPAFCILVASKQQENIAQSS
jgi:hypothetical protein